MIAESWGRVQRGTVWHLITAPDSTLCEGGLYESDATVPYIEVSKGLPPLGGRPCPRCVAVVDDLAVTVARAVARQVLPQPAQTRPIEDVDLLASLPSADEDGDR